MTFLMADTSAANVATREKFKCLLSPNAQCFVITAKYDINQILQSNRWNQIPRIIIKRFWFTRVD